MILPRTLVGKVAPLALVVGLALGATGCASVPAAGVPAQEEEPCTEFCTPDASEAAVAIPDQAADADTMAVVPGASATGWPSGLGWAPTTYQTQTGVAWTAQPHLLYVITWGSSNCPMLAELVATGGDPVVIALKSPAANVPCRRDLAPTTSVVQIPDTVADGAAFTAQVGDLGAIEVPARNGQPIPSAWLP